MKCFWPASFLCFAFCLFGPNSHAQFYIGLKTGYNSAKVAFNNTPEGGSAKSGINFGLVASKSIDVRKRLFLHTELLLDQKGYKSSDVTISNLYLDIPIMLRMLFKLDKKSGLKAFVNGGPYLGFGFGSNGTLNTASTNVNLPNYVLQKKVELGMGIGGGLMYPVKVANMDSRVFIEGRYMFGLTNLAPQEQLRNRVFSISVGLLIALPALNKNADPEVEAAPEQTKPEKENNKKKSQKRGSPRF